VQITNQLLPPFSGYLSDYSSPGNENMRLVFLFTDFSHATYDVKLKIKIQGQGITIQSPAWYFSGPVTLEPGVPKMLSGTDLSDLLNENNLEFSGITRAQYDLRKVLPEGFYTITVTAYDFQNPIPIQVSNEGIAQAWMVLNDPPYLNLPFCNASITPQTPQQITFSWTAMNLAAPSSALGSEYTLELWEVFPASSSPGNIVASTAPLFSYTTSQTLFNYGITEPPLVVGRQYVWRVHAHDLENRELFRNNGYSQLCTFSYGNTLDLLGNTALIHLNAQALTNRQARCWWDSLSIYANYRIEFRKVGTPNWFPLNTNHASLRIPDLEANTNYEAQVTGILADGTEGPVSNLANWHTPEKPVYTCGESAPPPSQQNFHPLTTANTGMIWQIGQFEMMVTSLNGNSNSAGWYSGLGKVVMPLGWTIACSFSGLQVGEDHVVYSGEVKGITEGISNWVSQYSMSQYQYDTSYFYNGNIDSLWVNANGDIVILDANGNQTTIDIDTNGGALFTDSNGDQWIVNANGTITFVTGGFLLPYTTDTLNTQEMRILKLAMTAIRNEVTENAISTQQNLFQSNQSALENYVSQQKQSIPASPSSEGETSSDTTEFVNYYEVAGNTNDQGYQLGSSYKESELNYYSSKVLQLFSRADCPDAELNFIGQYLTVNGIGYKQFVAQQLALGKTEQQIAADVADNGIKKLVLLVLTKQMSK
ncbi:MAG TPA: fibronectin type III domain-containing protein, partial [Bacteroidia bacterium]|nr:fibronectin type III domain-containing protein [Bacteroidia bacterium]